MGKTDKDTLTTVLGGVLAAGTAAQVVVNQVPAGTSLHTQDWIQLAVALVMGIFGWATNKQ